MRVRALLFDLHGTVAYIEHVVQPKAISDILVGRGYEIYPQAWKAALDFVSMIDFPRSGYGNYEALLSQVMCRLGADCDEQTMREIAAEYRKESWAIYDDAADALRRAHRKGIRTAIITTIPRFRFERFISPLSDVIDIVVDGSTFGCEKSDPKIYRGSLERLGVAPADAVMIGDEELTDVITPRTAGLQAILLDRTQRKGEHSEARAVISSLWKVDDLLDTWR